MTGPPIVAQTLQTVTTIAGVIAGVIGTLAAWLTWRATFKNQRGSDWDRLAGTLSDWSQETIAELQRRVDSAEADCRARIEQVETRLAQQWADRLAYEHRRADYWRARTLGTANDDTPPPDLRGPP